MLKVTFCGAARTVTGSMYYLEYEPKHGANFRFCLDAGMFQVGKPANLLKINSYLLFEPKKLDAIVLTHAHLDHCGRIPYLVKQGFGGLIYSTPATKEIATVVMYDAAMLNNQNWDQNDYFFELEEVESTFKKSGHQVNRLYSEAEVDLTIPRFKTFDYHHKFQIHENLEVEFFDAGHILGSAFVVIKEIDTGQKILFSGDLGNRHKPIIQDPEMAPAENNFTHIFTETTYGNRDHPEGDPRKSLYEIAKKTINRNGKLLIPAFSVERAQELIYLLVEMFEEKKLKNVPIFLDSPMAQKVLEITLKHPELYDTDLQDKINNKANPLISKKLTILETAKDSQRLNGYKDSCVIVAGSGMLTGGRMLKHLRFHIENERNTVMFVGYQAEGTLGRKIIKGNKEITIEHKEYEVKAEINALNFFSAHADRNILADWLKPVIFNTTNNPKPTVFLMHGEKSTSLGYQQELHYRFANRLDTYWPHFGETKTLWN